ncbi:MAG: hypothetical protein SAL70_27300 [Scytonema sp. PMC 1070.18]|nr:hypothetical protein [Scytonema sp. PMC 1070.18]
MKRIGLFANHKGFSMVVVDLYRKKFTVLEVISSSKPSYKIIKETLEKLKKIYKTNKVIHNNDIKLDNLQSFTLYPQELNLKGSIFQISALCNDGILLLSPNTTELQREINDFDEEIINHKVYALMLAITEIHINDPSAWLLNR